MQTFKEREEKGNPRKPSSREIRKIHFCVTKLIQTFLNFIWTTFKYKMSACFGEAQHSVRGHCVCSMCVGGRYLLHVPSWFFQLPQTYPPDSWAFSHLCSVDTLCVKFSPLLPDHSSDS